VIESKNLETGRMSKGKAVPLQNWTGPEGSGLRLPDFNTFGT
jgi:hypothetical protein